MDNTKSIFKAMNAVIESSFDCIATKADSPQQMNFPTDAQCLIRKRNGACKQWEIIRNIKSVNEWAAETSSNLYS
jgi:hypothetical protein